MDDVLKSVPSVRDALILIHKVTDMCKRGGFKLQNSKATRKMYCFKFLMHS